MINNSNKYFCNSMCAYFPCHKTDTENFNCMFCFCPLYYMGDKCGGNFTISSSGKKSCVNCDYPHKAEHYDEIMNKLKDNPINI